jgi:hypothetical protein
LDHQCILRIVLKVFVTTAVTNMASRLTNNDVWKSLHWVYFINRLSNVKVYIEMVNNLKIYLMRRLYVLNMYGMIKQIKLNHSM